MTALVARQPLHPLSMSSSQRLPRRLSARLQEKDDGPEQNTSKSTNGKKRKNAYDEEDDGFMFTRVKTNKQRNSTTEPAAPLSELPHPSQTRSLHSDDTKKDALPTSSETVRPVKKKPPKMSFSTPKPQIDPPLRRSKRLSSEHDPHDASPKLNVRKRDAQVRQDNPEKRSEPEAITTKSDVLHHQSQHPEVDTDRNHSATKIALPFADTPVIRRNKAMRENKSGKGERRSSLSLRGRRASSLIDSGNSNALPHVEVEVPDFYKHIESDGLPEPRRMRQLLTWCATRCLDQKPFGAEFEDASAVAAARVIEEELLKDLANRSEMSDWFAREDVLEPPEELAQRPNPKNLQNAEKIKELEGQIQRLRSERDSLEALLRPPSIPIIAAQSISEIDKSLLIESDMNMFDLLISKPNITQDTSKRINSIQGSLGLNVDTFADGIHKVAQYRNAADALAANVLSVCSQKLAEREERGRKTAVDDRNRSPRRDLNGVLRGLSRIDC